MFNVITDGSEIFKEFPLFNSNDGNDWSFLLRHYRVNKSVILDTCKCYGYILDFINSRNCINDIPQKVVDQLAGNTPYEGDALNPKPIERPVNLNGLTIPPPSILKKDGPGYIVIISTKRNPFKIIGIGYKIEVAVKSSWKWWNKQSKKYRKLLLQNMMFEHKPRFYDLKNFKVLQNDEIEKVLNNCYTQKEII